MFHSKEFQDTGHSWQKAQARCIMIDVWKVIMEEVHIPVRPLN